MKLVTKLYILLVSCFVVSLQAVAQVEPTKPTYEPSVVVKDEKYYIQKALPVYLKFSTSPNGKEYPLKSAEHPADANPMYFDTEGVNYVRSKWAVDPVTKKTLTPQREVLMEVYADGIAPVTTLKYDGAPQFYNNGVTYFGKGLSFSLSAVDAVSGVMETQYSLENSYAKYTSAVNSIKEGANTLFYYSADAVGNVEKAKMNEFTLDLTPPTSNHSIDGLVYEDKIIAPNTRLILKTFDNLSGINYVYYALDKGAFAYYTQGIGMHDIADGEHTLYYYAVDNVKNEAVKKSFNFYVDKLPPTVTPKILGDQYDKGLYAYVSPRTKLSLTAIDNKAGVDRITYRLDGKESFSFSTDFLFPNKIGYHMLEYYATDNAENVSETKTVNVFMDNLAPETDIIYGNPQFFVKDTLYISGQTPVMLKSNDGQSGVKSVDYAVDNATMKPYDKFTITDHGPHTISFSGLDNVNNKEEVKSSIISVDNLAPDIYVNFSIQPIGKKGDLNIYPNYVRVYIGATDKNVGSEKLLYSVDGGPLVNYSAPHTIDISESSQFKDKKKYNLRVIAEDKLGNKSEKTLEFYVGRKTD